MQAASPPNPFEDEDSLPDEALLHRLPLPFNERSRDDEGRGRLGARDEQALVTKQSADRKSVV